MEPLFELEMVSRFEQFDSFCRLSGDKRFYRSLIIVAVLYVLATIGWFIKGYMVAAAFFALVAVGYPIYATQIRKRNIKRVWCSNKTRQDEHLRYVFYKDHVVEISSTGTAAYEFTKLYDVLENKKVICLYIAEGEAMVLDKQCCGEELLQFLRNIKSK